MSRKQERFDATPLVEIVEGRGGPQECLGKSYRDGNGKPRTPRLVQQYYRAARRGVVTEYAADELAVKLGYHPCEIWPEWFADCGVISVR